MIEEDPIVLCYYIAFISKKMDGFYIACITINLNNSNFVSKL
jgi:hypothetical protein